MNIFKTMVSDGTSIFPMDTVEYEGGLWLVPLWLEAPETGWQTPARIIRMDILPHRKLGPPFPADYTLPAPIPKGVLDGTTPSQQARGYVVIDHPAIKRPTGTAH
jgi:hypothetical protein